MVKQLFTKFLLLNQVKISNWLQYGISLFFLKFASILHYANLDLAIKSYLFRQAAKENVLVFITLKYV